MCMGRLQSPRCPLNMRCYMCSVANHLGSTALVAALSILTVTCYREDLQSLPMGCKLMKTTKIASHELVARPGLWHSNAQVIEGKFRLLSSQHDFMQWAERHGEGNTDADTFWCNKTWDPTSGQLLTCHEQPKSSRKSCSLNSRYILA